MRDFLFFAGVCTIAVGLGAVLFLFGPTSLQSDVQGALQTPQSQIEQMQQVQFQILEQGVQTFSASDRANYRITSEYDLETLWPMIYGERDAPHIPTVDFSKYEILAVFDGSHSTSGYGIQVQQITDLNPVRTLTIEHWVPSASCAETTGTTEPYELVQVPKTIYTLAHVDVTLTSAC